MDEYHDEYGRELLVPPMMGAPLISRNGHPHSVEEDGYIHAEISQVESLRIQGARRKQDIAAEMQDIVGVDLPQDPVPDVIVQGSAVLTAGEGLARIFASPTVREERDGEDVPPVKPQRRKRSTNAKHPGPGQ